jgi:hypothetical protein
MWTILQRPIHAAFVIASAALTCAPALGGAACPCAQDLNGEGIVDGADLGLFLSEWGACGNCPPVGGCVGDFNGDCNVDGADLGILLGNWGPCEGLPPNDACADAVTLAGLSGSFNKFCTLGATTDGPTTGNCYEGPDQIIHSDVWYRFVAPATGTAQIGVCADFDVRAAIYDESILVGGCSCPGTPTGGPLIACGQPVAFPVPCETAIAMLAPIEAGKCYTIRIGGSAGQQGKGSLDINLYLPPCDITSSSKLASGGIDSSDEFGISLDISGDTAVAGAIFDDFFGLDFAGTARVFTRNGVGWTQQDILTGPAPFDQQRFGVSAAISGDRIAVGAGDVEPGCSASPDCDTGAVFVFENDRGNWIQVDELTPTGGTPEDHFGSRVDIDGTRIVVGARTDDNPNGDRAGAAYVYERIVLLGNPIWVQTAKLVASDGDDFDEFGIDVAVSGQWAIIGADADEGGGSAYLFNDLSGPWQQIAKLDSPASASGFGHTVAIDGDFAVVGAPESFSAKGAAYVYENVGGTWELVKMLTAHDGAGGDRFGSSVSLNGKYLLVGAAQDDGSKGAAYLFWHVNGGWIERAKLTAADAAASDSFNIVAVGDGFGLVGAYLDNTPGGTDAGSVSIFNSLGECNGNGVVDACDIAGGASDDLNGNGVPDECDP